MKCEFHFFIIKIKVLESSRNPSQIEKLSEILIITEIVKKWLMNHQQEKYRAFLLLDRYNEIMWWRSEREKKTSIIREWKGKTKFLKKVNFHGWPEERDLQKNDDEEDLRSSPRNGSVPPLHILLSGAVCGRRDSISSLTALLPFPFASSCSLALRASIEIKHRWSDLQHRWKGRLWLWSVSHLSGQIEEIERRGSL